MDYEKLMLKIKNEKFPELKDVNVHLKPLKILDSKILEKIYFKPTMVVFPYTRTIYYNKRKIKGRDIKIISAILAHELAHVKQTKKLNWFQETIHHIRYYTDSNYRSRIEKGADIIAIKKGFEKGLIMAKKDSRKLLSKSELRRASKIYYSSEELEKFQSKLK